MANKEKLLEKQKELGDEIVAIREKLAQKAIRSSRLPEVNKRISKIEAEFAANNTKLLAYGITSEDYFEKKYYGALSKIIAEIQLLIKETLEQEELISVPETTQTSKENSKLEKVVTTESYDELWEQFVEMADWLTDWYDELSANVADMSNKKLQIKEKFLESRYQKLQNIYHNLSESKKPKNMHKIMLKAESTYFSALELISDCINEPMQQPSNINEGKYSNSAHLGKIEIPEFSGDINEWSSFHDLFKSLVHDNKHLSNVEKMYRLVTSLKGEAKKLVQHLKITDNNYQATFEILKQRYENHRLLFTNQVDILLDQPIANSESSASLKQLLDTTNSCIYALKSMDIKIEDAEPFIARIVIRKLDKDGLRYYEQTVKKSKEIQSLKDILSFLEQQVQALEAASKGQEKKTNKKLIETGKGSHVMYLMKKCCLHCNMDNHTTANCRKFLALPIYERRKLAYNNKWCFKCLDHKNNKWCSNNVKCCYCNKGHHKILHLNEEKIKESKPNNSAMTTKNVTTSVLLATAQVKVHATNGEAVILRALIDQGSQVTTISEEASQILSLPRIKCKTEIHGIGSTLVGLSKAKTKLILKPRFMSNHEIEADALILPKLTGAHPNQSFEFSIEDWNNFILADPAFNKSDRIDIVIGGDIIPHILQEGLHKKGSILAQSTIFGWILSGVISKTAKPTKLLAAVTNLERFWEMEEIPDIEKCHEDEFCQEHYERTTEVDGKGHIVVKLPLKEDHELGESRSQAMARFLSLEKKFDREPELKKNYVKFMNEYLNLGHMKRAEKKCSGKYYLPHQPIIRENSLTTKLRVVFDASTRTTNRRSLNDVMFAGPKLQKDLFDILIKWRQWRYVMIADVEKMYRQVRMANSDQSYQHILWRENKCSSIEEYKLTTVTYGMSAAPFLAVRSLFYIADHMSIEDELIKKIIKEDFYMDDLMTGADNVQQCKNIRHHIQAQLHNFGFNLRKWVSNHKTIINHEDVTKEHTVIQIRDDETVKTLGLQWDPAKDEFHFKVNFTQNNKITKRQALSDVAKIFDPLGWMSPVTVLATLLIQTLWLRQSSWDDVLSDEFQDKWYVFSKDVITLQKIRIPIWVKTTCRSKFEIHGFSDAFEKAYAAVVYIKQNKSVTLLTAKSKVNPIKNRKTLPKLELCAANLLSKLLHRVIRIFNRQCKVSAWSDSTITLGWIHNNKNKDKFVRNKVNEINTNLPEASWHHVSSKDNPADVASRGTNAEKLMYHSLWWNGPKWLLKSSEFWPKYEEPKSTNLLRTAEKLTSRNIINKLVCKYSKLGKLRRIVAYVLRFVNKLRRRENYPQHLTVPELEAAEKIIIFNHQQVEFHDEIMRLKKGLAVSNKSQIVSLFPFLDKDGILRVGGRLHNSGLQYNHKHPIILQKSELSSLIIHQTHMSTLHGRNRLMESTIKRKYWIMGLKNAVKKCIGSCTTCIRYQQKVSKQLMGSLPDYRVNVSHPFTHTGVDYAGPIHLRCSKGRGQKSYKGYIAVFVCMATKAIHLEVVSDLTTEAFHAALRRFFSRRGVSSHLYSDNGTTFVGASKKLDAEFKAAVKNNSALIPILAEQKINWHFIPPAAPHFGGIWESGVKSMKYHLKRIIGETKLTFEELSTLLAQIEAVLNSRPLVEVNAEDIDAVDVLSPGHFLIGRPVIEPAEHIESAVISSLNKWKLIQRLKKDFWNRWKEEYLVTLQQRNKWKHSVKNLKEGAAVLVRDENTHPGRWPLGRITEVSEGKDGKVRVVKIRYQNNILKRPIHKIIQLPEAEDSNENSQDGAKNLHTNMKQTNGNNFLKSFLLWCMFLMLTVGVVNSASLNHGMGAEVKEIPLNTALHLDNIGTMNVVNSKWNLIIHYDLDQYFEEITRIKKLKKKLEDQCPKLRNYKEACEMVVWSVNRRFRLVDQNNSLLLKKKKEKRSPFEFVGSIYHLLFGMMDAEDRKLMEENMRSIFQNEDKLQQLAKQQTSIVNSTINVLKKTTEEVNDNFSKMYGQLKLFYEEIQNNTNTERLIVMFQVMTTQLHLMIDECKEIQSSIMNLMIDVNHGHINPDLLTAAQLQQELLNIRKLLPNDLILPGAKPGTELKEVYSSMTARGIVVDNRLVIQAEIPLYNIHTSEIYEIIRLPVDGNGTAMIPIVDGDYIIYNFATNLYFLMWQSQLNVCTKNHQGQYNCKEEFSWKPAVERSCEVSALKQSRHAECYFQETPRKCIWKKLSTENQWIFTVFDQLTLSIDCGNKARDWLTLPSKGILNLPAGCTAVYEGITLPSSQHFTTKKKTSIQTSSWGVEFQQANNKLVKPFDVTIINNSKDIQNIHQNIQKMQADNTELMKMKYHHYKCNNSTKTIVKLDFSPPIPLNARQNVQM